MNFRQLQVSVDASSWPVTLAEMKAHLRKTDTAEDTLIEALIQAATVMVENHTGVSMAVRTLVMRTERFPCRSEPTVLWYPPVASLVSVKYWDEANIEQVLHPSIYDADVVGSWRPRVQLAWGQVWPTLRDRMAAVSYEYTTQAFAASPLKIAAMMMAADLFENRESQITSQYFGERSVIENPTMRRLLAPYTLGH